LVLSVCLLLAGSASAREPSQLDELLERAEEMRLHEHPYWWTLLHYKKGVFGVRSLVDDPRFFVAPDGKQDPRAELRATLQAFCREDRALAEEAACRFVARYAWLGEALGFKASGILAPACPRLNEILEKIDPQGATMIFPTSSMNSPASMFGHTLIRFESSGKSKLTCYAVNYAAITHETNGFLFAFKGIFGLYEGYFSVLPYYQKVQEYSDISQRDIWEYRLNFTQEEVTRMLLHLYELENLYTYYYFFDENCSYTLLFLLDAARPSLHLTDRFRIWVMPIDTIRDLEEAGLIENAEFRPSRATKIRNGMSVLSRKGRRLAMEVVRGEKPPEEILEAGVPDEEKRRILDLAIGCIQYRYATRKLAKEPYIERFMEASEARSRLGMADAVPSPVPPPEQPQEGHKPNRLSIGFGVKGWNRPGDHSLFQEIRFRPTYHDFMDADEGYVKGSRIEFFNTVVRYYNTGEGLELETLDLINIESVSERGRFFKPVSWKVKTGLTRKRLPETLDGLVYLLSAGGGLTYRNKHLGLYSFMAEAEVNAGDQLRDAYALGAGGSFGLVRRLSWFWKLHLSFRPVYFFLGDRHLLIEWEARQQFKITPNTSLSMGVSGRKIGESHEAESLVTFHLYF